ncbi:archease [Candidatus Bathyarchaeota archaeon]|nr:archease [Candidatus Bathyarchaeota archaeon]
MGRPEHREGFRFLEHTGDAYIEAYGKSLSEAFANSALAMFEVMTDTSKVEPKIEESVEVEGHDLESLLYSWLETLLVRCDIENRLYSKFIVEILDGERERPSLKAKIYGEDYDPTRHTSKTEVKAVTFHMMEIKCSGGYWRLRFLLDL